MHSVGTTLKVEPDGDSAVVAGGPLGKKQYLLDHFHFHWGSVDSRGSEHLLNGKAFAAEVMFNNHVSFYTLTNGINKPRCQIVPNKNCFN